MITDFKEVEKLFIELNGAMQKKTNAYVIGGAALLKKGLKDATKDIDLIVASKQEFFELLNTLVKIGFTPQIPGKEYSHMNLSQIFQRKDFRIDLFQKKVCGMFSLSESMMERVEKALELNKINVFLCSSEDILLFKTMTERPGDIDDCISIAAKQNLDWDILLDELKIQIGHSRQDVWITWIGERLDLLVERGVDIPIMDEINKLREQFFDDYEKRHSKNNEPIDK